MASARASSSFLSPPGAEQRRVRLRHRRAAPPGASTSRGARARLRLRGARVRRRSGRPPPRSRGWRACGTGAGSGRCGRCRGGRPGRASGPRSPRRGSGWTPRVGASAPETQLNSVVFPEPFGPIRPRISPSRTSKDTLLRAVNPPNRLVSPVTVSTGGSPSRDAPAGARPGRAGALAAARGERRGRRQRQDGLRGGDDLGIDQLELALDDLEHGGIGALVLARAAVAPPRNFTP